MGWDFDFDWWVEEVEGVGIWFGGDEEVNGEEFGEGERNGGSVGED